MALSGQVSTTLMKNKHVYFRWWDIRNFEKAKDKFIVDTENKNPEYAG